MVIVYSVVLSDIEYEWDGYWILIEADGLLIVIQTHMSGSVGLIAVGLLC